MANQDTPEEYQTRLEILKSQQKTVELNEKYAERAGTVALILIFFVGFLVLISILFGTGYVYGLYNVKLSSLHGEAELKQAEWNRQIAVKEAEAKKNAAVMLAQAEVERAKGVAQANKIIGDSLKGNEDYLHYLWIDSLHNTKNQIVYVPTETNLPILEASRNNKTIIKTEGK